MSATFLLSGRAHSWRESEGLDVPASEVVRRGSSLVRSVIRSGGGSLNIP